MKKTHPRSKREKLMDELAVRKMQSMSAELKEGKKYTLTLEDVLKKYPYVR